MSTPDKPPGVTGLETVAEPARSASARLRDGLLETFGEDLVAIWLYGGQLSPGGSTGDVDLHVVLAREPDDREFAAIRVLHDTICRDLAIDELDAWYVLLDEITSGRRPRDVNWHVEIHDENWALKRAHWFAGAYVPVHGVRPEEIVPRPTWSEVEAELVAQVDAAGSDDHRHAADLTLRLCRVLRSLETREVVQTKVDAAEWAIEKFPAPLQDHIAAAIRTYKKATRPDDDALITDRMDAFYDHLRMLLVEALRDRRPSVR